MMSFHETLLNRRVFLVVWTVVVIAASVTSMAATNLTVPEARQSGITVRIEPDTIELRALDPLFMKVVAENHGDDAVLLAGGPLTTRHGALVFEMNRHEDDDDEFRAVRTPLQNRDAGGAPAAVPPRIRPRDVYVAHEVLFRQEGGAVFDLPGTYDLRFEHGSETSKSYRTL